MSKMAAIHTAISLQLAADGKDLATNGPLKGSAEKPGYDADTALLFLSRVAFRLRIDTPSLVFNWQALNPGTILDYQRTMLEDTIGLYTQPAPPDVKGPPA